RFPVGCTPENTRCLNAMGRLQLRRVPCHDGTAPRKCRCDGRKSHRALGFWKVAPEASPTILRRPAAPPPFRAQGVSPMPTTYDVLGIGNAIVDVIARTEDDFLVKHAMPKGTMALIDEARAEAIYASMGQAIEAS